MVKLEIEKSPRGWLVNTLGGTVMEKIKNWYNTLTGATKFMFILAIIFTIANISLIIVIESNTNKIIDTSNYFIFSSDRASLFAMFGLSNLFDGLKQGVKCAVIILFNIFGYYISVCIGKFFGFFKSITEMLTDIALDGWGYFSILLYDALSLFFDILTVASFITAIK